jgi:small subunit ribosomal protein S13
MARLAGVNIPDNKHALVSLTYIYGVGRTQARRLLDATGISYQTKVW